MDLLSVSRASPEVDYQQERYMDPLDHDLGILGLSIRHYWRSGLPERVCCAGLKSGDLQTLLQSADAIASRGIKFDVSFKVPCHADRGDTAVVQHLLEFGAPTEYRDGYTGYTALEEACRKGHGEVVELLLEHGADTRHALTAAVSSGQVAIARMLIDRGVDVNRGCPPPIVRAVQLEHVEMFRLLRRHGAVLDTLETG
ncbi:hypothetical protein LTS18_014336 [Coniosporium uncinatum]|uniref:Uncharacterized protein n=1 Tax=Coniosporium uncinatum TaxID=93489 RepID=A0ACC3DV29_9PEZI|nr:hypothetical protein LTS18_014336 [Coniosporium uncinatum]